MRKTNLGYVEGWLSIAINTVLFCFKFWAGITSGSLAMLADAWHTLSDSITSIIVIIGFWISGSGADEEHPFGHGKSENVAAVIIATLFIILGVNFFRSSIIKLKSQQSTNFGSLAIIVFIGSTVIKEALARFSIWAGKKINSKSLLADGWHHRSDAIASGTIVISVLIGRQYLWLDGIMGILVSLLIIYVGYNILKEASSSLLGEKVTPALESQIRKLIKNTSPLVSAVHHLHMHKYGKHMELTLHICLPENIELKDAHDISSKLEEVIKIKLKMETTIHMEPRKT